MEKEELGIEVVKRDLVVLIDLGLQVAEALKDKKITAGEGISLVFKVPSVWKVAKSMPEFIAELKDIDPDEAQELIAFLVEKYGDLIGQSED